MNISARNVLEGTVKGIKEGTTTAHVVIDVKGLTVTSSITNESVHDLRLHVGDKVMRHWRGPAAARRCHRHGRREDFAPRQAH